MGRAWLMALTLYCAGSHQAVAQAPSTVSAAFSLPCSPAHVPSPKTAEDDASAGRALALAQRLATEGDTRGAQQLLEHSVAGASTADAWYQLGVVRFARGDARCSLAAFTSAAALRPPRGEDLRFVALDYVLLNDPADAEYWFRAALKLEPTNGEAWYDLGRMLYQTRRYGEARDALHRALLAEPVSPLRRVRSVTYLGLIAQTTNDLDRAETDYRTAISDESALARPFMLPFRSLGVLLREGGRLGEALPLLQKAVALAPDDAVSHAELGDCLVREGQWTIARDQLQIALQLHPGRPAWHFQLGRIDQVLGDKAASAREFALAKTEIDDAPAETPDQ